jgi:hypothetical protein
LAEGDERAFPPSTANGLAAGFSLNGPCPEYPAFTAASIAGEVGCFGFG